jgi:hypothetical protein
MEQESTLHGWFTLVALLVGFAPFVGVALRILTGSTVYVAGGLMMTFGFVAGCILLRVWLEYQSEPVVSDADLVD